jgi:uncharacterized protein YqhQ
VKFSGISHPNGCNIYSDHFKLRIFERRGRTKYTISKRVNPQVNPLLVGFVVLDVAILFLPQIAGFITSLIPEDIGEGVSGAVEAYPWLIDVLATAVFILYMYFIINMLLRTRRWHGCEHKLIAAAEENDIASAMSFSPIHDRCGTTYLLTMGIIMAIPLFLFGWFLFTLVAVGIILESKYFHMYNKPGILIGRLIQKYNAIEPEGYKLHVGIRGMKELVEREFERAIL